MNLKHPPKDKKTTVAPSHFPIIYNCAGYKALKAVNKEELSKSAEQGVLYHKTAEESINKPFVYMQRKHKYEEFMRRYIKLVLKIYKKLKHTGLNKLCILILILCI